MESKEKNPFNENELERKQLGSNTFGYNWIKTQVKRLRKIFPKSEISDDELKQFLLNEYKNRKTVTGRFYSNTTNENRTKTIENFINDFLEYDYILTGYNVLMKNQSMTKTVAIEALEYILNQRKIYKKRMQEAEKGSPEYIYNKVLQLTFKILANSYYGVMSMEGSLFYNKFCQNSITTTGQDLISTAIYLMEHFIANNEPFRDTNEIIAFVTNVCDEKYSILEYLTNIKTKDEVKEYLLNKSMIREEIDTSILDKLLNNRTQDELNKIYYKNNLIELFKNNYFKTRLEKLIPTGEEDPEFRDVIVQCGMYNYIAWDRFIRISQQKRRASLVTDTDSSFLYLGKLVEQIQNIISNYDDKDKINICNFIIYIMTEAMKRIFKTFTDSCKIPETHSEIINIKNEFIYSRIMTTRNKKNYAGWLLSELGKPIPGDNPSTHLDMKGLSIRKSTVAKSLREEFQNLLINDILLPKKIDVLKVMKHYNDISNTVTKSIRDGKTEFLIPKSVDPFDKYKNPASVEQVKSTIIWNALEPNQSITPPDNVKLVKIAAKTLDHPEMTKLSKLYPDKYKVIEKTIFQSQPGEFDISKNGFTAISIPLDLDRIPEYIRPLIDYDIMVNANVKNANILLESLGVMCVEDKSKSTNYKTNIVKWM